MLEKLESPHPVADSKPENTTPNAGLIAKLSDAIKEAEGILSRHDGVHRLHSDCQALIMMAKVAQSGGSIEVERLESIMRRMRICDRKGVYPVCDDL